MDSRKNGKNYAIKAVIGRELHGQRLDSALGFFLPGLGLRARRRLWEYHQVLLDGRAARPGEAVRDGQILELLEQARPEFSGASGLEPVSAAGGFVFFNKPRGLASAAVSGSPEPSAEEVIRLDWDELRHGFGGIEPPASPPLLCNRLDTATSGLLTAAADAGGVERFRAWEKGGEALKYYLALVRGVMAPGIWVFDKRLDTDTRRRTAVLDCPDPDPLRATRVVPLAEFGEVPGLGGVFTLVEARIRRGARHQIRVHLADAGYPIAGDTLYGEADDAATGLFLHHAGISLPGISAELPPPWAEWPLLAVSLHESCRWRCL